MDKGLIKKVYLFVFILQSEKKKGSKINFQTLSVFELPY